MLRESTPQQEGVMRVSRFLSVQALLDTSEMEKLLTTLQPFHIVIGGAVSEKGKGEVSPTSFLAVYRDYVEALKAGKLPEETHYRERFSDFWTVDTDILYAIPVAGGSQVIRTTRPVLQLQAHSMSYSARDGKFRPHVLGKECIVWGIQFTYPQIYQDPKTGSIQKLGPKDDFPNALLFKNLQRSLRSLSTPTPFLVEGRRINVPMRLGKACRSWIHAHPQLKEKNITVE